MEARSTATIVDNDEAFLTAAQHTPRLIEGIDPESGAPFT